MQAMHRPPAAAWEVRAGRWYACLLFFLAGLAAAAVFAFLFLQSWSFVHVLLLLVFVLSLWGVAYGLHHAPAGTLRWDGELWHWSAGDDEALLVLRCALDLQRCMLLRVDTAAGRSLWLWVEAQRMNAGWLAFRRAVVSGKVAVAQNQTQEL